MKLPSPSRRAFLVTATATLGLTLAGCQQAANQSGALDQAAEAAAAKALPNIDDNPATYEQVVKGGTLTFGIGSFPTNFNVWGMDGNDAETNLVQFPATGQTRFIDREGAERLDPDYLEALELTSESPQVVTMTMNPKGVYSNGEKLDFRAWQGLVRVMSDTSGTYRTVTTSGWVDIDRVERGKDDFQVVFHFKKTYIDWKNLLNRVPLPPEATATPEAFNEGYTGKALPNTGPYTVTTFNRTGGLIELTPNPNWWGRAPKLDKIVFRVVSAEGQPQAFNNGEIDVLRSLNADSYLTAKNKAGTQIKRAASTGFQYVALNVDRPALKDLEVRRAIAKAIDRNTIAMAALNPLETPVALTNNYIYQPTQPGYEDTLGDAVAFDPEAAKKILDDAGYAPGPDGVRAKGATKLELSYVVSASAKVGSTQAQQVVKNLEAVGIKVNLNSVPADKYSTDYLDPGNFDIVISGWGIGGNPIMGFFMLYYPKTSADNLSNADLPEVGKLVEEASAEFDEAGQLRIGNEISRAVGAQLPDIPLYQLPSVRAIPAKLANYGPSIWESYDWTTIGYLP